jgi:hypothetical protein
MKDVLGVGVGDTPALDGVFDLGACVPALVLGSVLVRAGGLTTIALGRAPEPAAVSAAIDDGSMGIMRLPANDALGAGPIAAPTATPIASIPAASAALTRSEGRRGARWVGRVGVSGGVVIGSAA